MMKKLLFLTTFMVALIFASSDSYSAIKVLSVKGKVAYKSGSQWASLKNGTTLQEGTKISTGVRSYAVLQINQATVKVRQLTMMKIFANKLTNNYSQTNIGLKYGSINTKVKKLKKLKTIFKIHTPVATSSVRGTEENVFFGAKTGMIVTVISGSVETGSINGVTKYLNGNAVFHQKINQATAENILAKIKDMSLIDIFSENVTKDEKLFNDLFGDETIDNSDTIKDFYNIKGTPNTKVGIVLDY